MLRVLAVDLGATSARVCAVDLDAVPPTVEVLHRRTHAPRADAHGVLRWDWDGLMAAVATGLHVGLERGPVASIGVDTWGVDYGLLDGRGDLVAPPVSYRDTRTADWEKVVARVGADALYRTTGIQLMAINTLFQLAAHDRGELDRAAHLLMLPELVVHSLTGAVTGERTSAGTTAMVDLATGTWAPSLAEAAGVDQAILPTLAPPTTAAGTWAGIPVHLVGGHDTASAVVAAPTAGAFISSGSWLLVGTETPVPDTSERARALNFSNEPATFGGVRLLRNVVGMWLLEQVLAGRPSQPVLDAAASLRPGPVIDVADPPTTEEGVREAAGLAASAGLDHVVRCVIDSLAHGAASVLDALGNLTGAPVREICLVGGGAANAVFVEALRAACDAPVRVGPVEATTLGNALTQGVALGRFRDLGDARAAIRAGRSWTSSPPAAPA